MTPDPIPVQTLQQMAQAYWDIDTDENAKLFATEPVEWLMHFAESVMAARDAEVARLDSELHHCALDRDAARADRNRFQREGAIVAGRLAALEATAQVQREALEIAIDVLRMCESSINGREAYIRAAIAGGEAALLARTEDACHQ